jgi:large subunit ribosomal protein L23
MRNVHDIIIKPVVTEKTTDQLEKNGAYTFVVARDANKIQIGRAIEELFGVKVREVRTMRYAGKQRRVGRFTGRRSSWKKAVVTLRAGDTIEIFEGV